jgi:hypothetical protein
MSYMYTVSWISATLIYVSSNAFVSLYFAFTHVTVVFDRVDKHH